MSVSFLLRIMQFISTTDAKDITALLSDTTHQILAIFKFDPAIVGFENKYHQRMTYNTVHRIIRVKKANLRFMTTKYINQNFKFKLDGSLEIAVLEILDFEIFLIDPYLFEKSIEYKLKYVYDEADYTALCGKKAEPDVLKYDDGLIESP
ncbi:Telomere replication protein EST3 [Candida viswanathii]|uniref:Telomere replication protein EST3 n=1 Tax=Candida viswanathii TaxID=5486 RepID=A0A367YQB3_9ASCO|nr:Telomere replication protein EST3 [Candida viswanathii]